MDIAELIDKLKTIASLQRKNIAYEPEIQHRAADKLLLDFIDDEGVTDAFDDIEKWY
jgi:hypothetical protein